jgi:hypothetical protein
MYVQLNIEACSCKLCSGAVSITYTVRMCVALGIQREMRVRQIVIRDLPGSIIFCALSHKRYDLKKKVLTLKCVC